MRIAVTGSSGMVGRALTEALVWEEHDVVRLVRRVSSADDEVQWDPAGGKLEQMQRGRLEGLDAVVHLAGENIATGRWTAAKMERIRSSRVNGTRVLCEALAGLENKPATLVCASAIGFYGDRMHEKLTEDASRGNGYLADVCADWESACEPAREAGIRVVNLRIGMVLDGKGGALATMLVPFKLGVGGKMGNGRQFWSWITLTDLVSAIRHCLSTPTLAGPVNAVSPHPVTNAQFTKALGRALGRPTLFPMPGPVARVVLGKMADDLILASANVLPKKLEYSGFTFAHAEIEPALRQVLGKS
jgi:uncharacterized protein (TIGR01777 family)